jgi:hypothetical protein
MPDEPAKPLTTERALQQWRVAERAVAVARRGRLASEAAASAAAEAARAAAATADAARDALQSMRLAEESAAKTAEAARLAAQTTRVDEADADADLAMAEVNEASAGHEYHEAVRRAKGEG